MKALRDLLRGEPIATHVVTAAGVRKDRNRGGGSGGFHNGTGIASAALTTVDARGGDSDLVLVAVPAGAGPALVRALHESLATGVSP